MRTISIRLDEQTDSLLKTHCQRLGVTQTDAIKAAIEQLAARHRPTPSELAAELGLIGGFRSGVPDLAARRAQHIKDKLIAQRGRDAVPAAQAAAPVVAKPTRAGTRRRGGPVAA